MKRTPILVVAAVLLAAMAGCTPDAQETPTPEPVVSTPTPTPTPQWTEEEQAAIDAVQNYLAVWTDIGQNLETADWNAINDVASDPALSNAVDQWIRWKDNDWHLVGTPAFETDRVALGPTDGLGVRYYVHGCYIITDAYLADSDGNPLAKQGADRTTANYVVLHQSNYQDAYYVLEDTTEGNPC